MLAINIITIPKTPKWILVGKFAVAAYSGIKKVYLYNKKHKKNKNKR